MLVIEVLSAFPTNQMSCLDRLKLLFFLQVLDEDRRLLGAVDYYFIEEDGARCKHSPESAFTLKISLFPPKKAFNSLSFPHMLSTRWSTSGKMALVHFFFSHPNVALISNLRFRVSMPYRPYLYLHIKQDQVEATMAFISKK